MTGGTYTYDELIRRVAVILGLAAIATVSVWIMAPFLPAILWAGTIGVATWPALLRTPAHARGPALGGDLRAHPAAGGGILHSAAAW